MDAEQKVVWLDLDKWLLGRRKIMARGVEGPLRMRKGKRLIFDGDLFDLPDVMRDRCFATMALMSQHRHIVLTKRAKEMREYLGSPYRKRAIAEEYYKITGRAPAFAAYHGFEENNIPHLILWPLPNVMGMVSVEDQETANERVPDLLQTPFAMRGVSYEPALGAVNFMRWLRPPGPPREPGTPNYLNWIIWGSESGAGARDFDESWAWKSLAQCQVAGTAFFMKQLTEGGRKIPFDKISEGLQIRELPWKGAENGE